GSSSRLSFRMFFLLMLRPPPRIRPGGLGTRRRIEVAVTLLPQPDSPTRPSVLPSWIEHDTPSTARNSPASVSNPTFRSSISRSGKRPPLTPAAAHSSLYGFI